MNFYRIIVMGVSGCGKTTIGKNLARHLNYNYYDGDDYHSSANIAKMRNSIPLNDEDRRDWLIKLNSILIAQNKGTILSCSALKPAYRDKLSEGVTNAIFIYLKCSFNDVLLRYQQRDNHYFKGEQMLKSQFETLIEPIGKNVITIDSTLTIDTIIKKISSELANIQLLD